MLVPFASGPLSPRRRCFGMRTRAIGRATRVTKWQDLRRAERIAFLAGLFVAAGVPGMLSGCGGSKAPSAPLVFVKGRNVYVYDVEARTTRRLTSARDAVGDLALSPDGRNVAYTAAVHDGTDIRVAPLKGPRGRDVTPWASFSGVHTHIEPGWLSATQLVYVDDQRGASAAIGVVHAVDLTTGRRLAKRVVPRVLRGFVGEPLEVHAGMFAWPQSWLPGGGYHCQHTEDLWTWNGKLARRLTRTPQVWESPVDVEPGLPVLGSAGRYVSGRHSFGCTSDPHAEVRYELRAWRGTASTVLLRFPRANAYAESPREPEAAWSPGGKQLAVVDPAGRLSIRDEGGAWAVVARGVTTVDW